MPHPIARVLLTATLPSFLMAQMAGGPPAPQIQNQAFEAQRMFQMQQQLHRMAQQQQMQMQMQMQAMQRQQALQAQQQQAQRQRMAERQEQAARRALVLPPALMTKPTLTAWKQSSGRLAGYPLFNGMHLAITLKEPRLLRSLEVADGKERWTIGLPEKLALEPLFAGDHLIYVTRELELVMLNPETGEVHRKVALDPLDTYTFSGRSNHARALFPAVEGDTLILATYGKGSGEPTGWIYALDLRSATVKWKTAFPGGPDLTPMVKGDRVYVGGSGRVEALGLTDGKPIWKQHLGGAEELGDGALLDTSFTVLCGGRLHALDLSKGEVRWSGKFKGRPITQGGGDRLLFSEFRGAFIPSEWMVALDATTGKPAWELKVDGARMPWISEGRVLCNSDETLMALDLATGKPQWSRNLQDHPALPLTLFGESLYVLTQDRKQARLQALKVMDGSEIWSAEAPKVQGEGMILLAPEGFLLADEDQHMVLLK